MADEYTECRCHVCRRMFIGRENKDKKCTDCKKGLPPGELSNSKLQGGKGRSKDDTGR
jgi:hypothetical protein